MSSEEESMKVDVMNSSCLIQSRPKARRRSSCSALPLIASWEQMDQNNPAQEDNFETCMASLQSYRKSDMSLGTFLRYNSNSLSVSSQSNSDTSICGISEDDFPVDSSSCEKKMILKKKKKSRGKKKSSKEFPDTISPSSKEESSKNRRMSRRSSWSGAISTTYPQDDEKLESAPSFPSHEIPLMVDSVPADLSQNFERNSSHQQQSKPFKSAYHHDEESFNLQQSMTASRRRMNRRSSWHAATHFSSEPEDGVIASFKLSQSGESIMYEETLVTSENENSKSLPIDKSKRSEELFSVPCNNTSGNPIHSAPALLSDSTFPEKEFKRSLLMAKHIQSGATRAQRRASWSGGSTMNYRNYVDDTTKTSIDHVQRSTRDLFVEIISTCKKQAQYVPHQEDEPIMEFQCHDIPVPNPPYLSPDNIMDPTILVVPTAATAAAAAAANPTSDTFTTNQAERRASWHSACSQQQRISISTLNTHYSQQSHYSQKFIMDLSLPQKNWITKDGREEDQQNNDNDDDDDNNDNDNDNDDDDDLDKDCKSTTSGTSSKSKHRTWMMMKGKGRKYTNSRDKMRMTTPEESSSNLVVVSNANMPHQGQPCLQPFDDSKDIGFVQLTAFGDVTVIGHEYDDHYYI
jgi:hypothetical protein